MVFMVFTVLPKQINKQRLIVLFYLQERQVAAVTCADEEDVEEYQTMDDPGYQDFRAETSIHYQLRKECFQKAQEAFRRGLRQVAAFYSNRYKLVPCFLLPAATKLWPRLCFYTCV